MHFGALSPSAVGHLNPMATLCGELVSRGHRVTVMVAPDGVKRVRSHGLDCRPVAAEELPPGSLDSALEELGGLSGRRALRHTIDLYMRANAGLFRDVPGIVEDTGIEGLIVDQTVGAGRSIAERTRIPFVTLCAALMLNEEPGVPPYFSGWSFSESRVARLRNRFGNAAFRRLVRPVLNQVMHQRREWGLAELTSREDNDSPLAQICQIPRTFDYPRRQLPPQMHYVGPLHAANVRPPVPFDFSRLDGRPLIYASMGSLQNRMTHVFDTIARACMGLGAQLVLSFGRADATVPEDLPGSPIAVKYAPQLDLIPRASVVITHAGLNTAMESLAQGVPMVAIPVTNDQPAVAARIAWTGAGEVLPLRKLTVDRLRPLVRRVLDDQGYRDGARRIRNAISAAGGAARAGEIVERALGQNETILATR